MPLLHQTQHQMEVGAGMNSLPVVPNSICFQTYLSPPSGPIATGVGKASAVTAQVAMHVSHAWPGISHPLLAAAQ